MRTLNWDPQGKSFKGLASLLVSKFKNPLRFDLDYGEFNYGDLIFGSVSDFGSIEFKNSGRRCVFDVRCNSS